MDSFNTYVTIYIPQSLRYNEIDIVLPRYHPLWASTDIAIYSCIYYNLTYYYVIRQNLPI